METARPARTLQLSQKAQPPESGGSQLPSHGPVEGRGEAAECALALTDRQLKSQKQEPRITGCTPSASAPSTVAAPPAPSIMGSSTSLHPLPAPLL